MSESTSQSDAPETNSPQISLLDISVVTLADWEKTITEAETLGSAIVIFYTSGFAATPLFDYFLKTLVTQVLENVSPYRLFRFPLDSQPDAFTALLRNARLGHIQGQTVGLLWCGGGTIYALGDQAFLTRNTIDQALRALCISREIKLRDGSGLQNQRLPIDPDCQNTSLAFPDTPLPLNQFVVPPTVNSGYLNRGVRWTIIALLIILAVWNLPYRFTNIGAAARQCTDAVRNRAVDRDSVERRNVRARFDKFLDGSVQLSMFMDFAAKDRGGRLNTDTMICNWRRSEGSSTWIWQGPNPDNYSFRARPFNGEGLYDILSTSEMQNVFGR